MRLISIIFLFAFSPFTLIAQTGFSSIQPRKYNLFVNRPDIIWATEIESHYNFPKSKTTKFSITDYLSEAQRTGNIKSYITFTPATPLNSFFTKKFDDHFTEVHPRIEFLKENTDRSLALNSLCFQQILYIKDHKLQSQVISAGVDYESSASDSKFSVRSPLSYTALNYYGEKVNARGDEIVELGNRRVILTKQPTAVYFYENHLLKKNFDVGLTNNLLFSLTKGYSSLTDLRTKERISKEVITAYADSVYVPVYDASGNFLMNKKFLKEPLFTGVSKVEFIQTWYYNKTQNFFYNQVPRLFLYTEGYFNEEGKLMYDNEKRFQIDF